MIITKKFYPYFFFIIFILLIAGNFCLARKLEVTIPGLPNDPNLIDYRNVLFNFLIGIGITLAVLSVVIGAIKWMTSSGNPTSEGDAKGRIIGSVLGLVLLLSSYLIMKTINPQIVETETIPGLPITFGVFLTDGKEKTPCPESVADVSALPAGFRQIEYECGGLSPDKKPVLWIRKFPKTNLEGWTDAGAKVVEIDCDSGPVNITDAKSFLLDIKRPGLYLYDKAGASTSDSRSMQILTSQSEMNGMYKKNTKSFKLITGPGEIYGVLFHENIKGEGKCSDFTYTSAGGIAVRDLIISPSSFDFVQLNPDSSTSGDGVVFYSKPLGNKSGTKAGHYDMTVGGIVTAPGEKIVFNYKDVAGATDAEKNTCKTFQDCPGSIGIEGNYLVILFDREGYCQAFYTSEQASNIINTSWLLLNGRKINLVYVIPIK